jgi:hypothetical protein
LGGYTILDFRFGILDCAVFISSAAMSNHKYHAAKQSENLKRTEEINMVRKNPPDKPVGFGICADVPSAAKHNRIFYLRLSCGTTTVAERVVQLP